MKVWCKGLARSCANIKFQPHKHLLGNVEPFFKNKLEHSPIKLPHFKMKKQNIYEPLVHPKENV